MGWTASIFWVSTTCPPPLSTRVPLRPHADDVVEGQRGGSGTAAREIELEQVLPRGRSQSATPEPNQGQVSEGGPLELLAAGFRGTSGLKPLRPLARPRWTQSGHPPLPGPATPPCRRLIPAHDIGLRVQRGVVEPAPAGVA